MKKLIFLPLLSCLLFLTNCSVDNPIKDSNEIKTDSINVIMTTSDYSEGSLSLYTSSSNTIYKDILPIHSDAVVKTDGSDIYILERYLKDVLVKIDGNSIDSNGIEWELSLGAGSNPQDIAVLNNQKAYLSMLSANYLLIINPSTGDSIGTISLSEYVAFFGTDSAVGTPYAKSMVVHNSSLYIACQRLDASFAPADTSILLIVNTASDSVTGKINLINKNPSELKLANNKIYVACTGRWSNSDDGSIELINPTTNTNEGIIVGETNLGGSITNIEIVSTTKAYVGVYNHLTWSTAVKTLHLSTGISASSLSFIESASSIIFDGTFLFIGDNGYTNGGLVKVDIIADTAIGATIPTGLNPTSLALLKLN